MMPNTMTTPEAGAGGAGYGLAKQMLVRTPRDGAEARAALIRVNAILPTNVNTHLLHSSGSTTPSGPTSNSRSRREDAEVAFVAFQAMPIPYIEPIDISNTVLYFASDETRYVTGSIHRGPMPGSMLQRADLHLSLTR